MMKNIKKTGSKYDFKSIFLREWFEKKSWH